MGQQTLGYVNMIYWRNKLHWG